MADSSHRTTIIVAAITVIGAIVVALITNWDKFADSPKRIDPPPIQPSPSVPPVQPSPSVQPIQPVTPSRSDDAFDSVINIAGSWRDPGLVSELPGQHVFRSPDGRYEAERIGSDNNVHYQVREVASQKIMLITHAEFDTPNDVKAGTFSPESKAFAAVYHYGHEGKYSWIGIWSIESGALVRMKTRPGWTTDISSVFKQ